MRKHSKKLIAAVVGTAAAVALSGVAYAYWTNGGTGNGTATTGTTSDNLVITATGWASIVPGTSKPVDITLDNSANPYTSFVKKVVLDASNAGDTDGVADGILAPAGCDSSWFVYTVATINNTAAASSSTPYAGDDGTTAGSGAKLTFTNLATTSQDACKSAAVKLFLKVDNS